MQLRVTILFLALVLGTATSSAEDDSDAVRSVFASYRRAILSGDGDAAAALLSQSTYDYYAEMKYLALYGSSEEVKSQSLVNQMQVLMYRLRIPTEQLESMSPRSLFAHEVNLGWIGKSSVVKLQPGKVISEGNAAALHVVVDGQVAGAPFQFNRESAQWRLDLVPTTQARNAALETIGKQQGVSGEGFMLILMESVLGRKVGAEDWEAPLGVARSEGSL